MDMTIKEIQDEIIDEFAMFDDWMQRYEYIIELGKNLPLIKEEFKTEENIIKGCQSKVWLQGEQQGDAVVFTADSDAILTKGIIAILILEFKTFKSTFIVLSVIPLGMIGAILILLFTGNSLSFTAIVGIIALAGIEVKNSILLVDYTNFLRKENGLSIDAAIEEAGETRFIPIVLTTMTAIGGMIPLIMEHSPLYSPLALVIVGGLISSLILTRIVTPVMYKLLPPSV
jgi:multidrug efflux pump subunit AcrB